MIKNLNNIYKKIILISPEVLKGRPSTVLLGSPSSTLRVASGHVEQRKTKEYCHRRGVSNSFRENDLSRLKQDTLGTYGGK